MLTVDVMILVGGVLYCGCAQSSHQELSLRKSTHLGYEEVLFAATANVKRKRIKIHYLSMYLTNHTKPDSNCFT
jgi:hypothetical protein